LSAETIEGVFAPQDVALTAEALEQFEEFRRFVDGEKRGLDGREQEWFVKTETHVLRLAGTLAFLAWAMPNRCDDGLETRLQLEPTGISAEFVAAAIHLVRSYFWPHARAALRQIGASQRHADTRRLMRWVKAQGKTEISREDARRDALARKLDAKGTELLLDRLTQSGWLRPVPVGDAPKGRGRPPRRWAVNPALFEGSS
jgi:hypothetical protein